MEALLVALTIAATPLAPPAAPWEAHNCRAPVTRRQFRKLSRRIHRDPRPVTGKRYRKIRRGVQCAASKRSATLMRRNIAHWRSWRGRNAWLLRFERLPASWRAWARRTSACESDYPSQHGGGGIFHGAFQFMLSTWRSAGGRGDPHTKSWYEQAVIAVRLARREGTQHWPRCG